MPTYSPERRTALVLCGTGAHGAYHAGVLKALHEAGVKIDIFAGHGIGAAGAVLGAIGGASRLWEDGGVWRGKEVTAFYRWRTAVKAIGWAAAAAASLLVVPLAVLALGLVAFPAGYLVQMVAPGAGAAIVGGYAGIIAAAFASPNLPTIVPRLIALVLATAVAGIGVSLAWRKFRVPGRRALGPWWWRVAGAPVDGRTAERVMVDATWQLVRGASAGASTSRAAVGARYAEAVVENLGQPGVGELIVVATDIDARRDVVAALLREPHRTEFLAPRPGRDRRSEVVDFTGIGRDYALDVVAAALTPPTWCEPVNVTFAPDSFWRGETHRLCDRPGITSRVLEEVAAAGASQVIVVTAVAAVDTPHRLRALRLDLLGRMGQFQMAAEAAALRDALEMARLRFDAVHVVSPTHNPLGPFDLAGVHDEASDRRYSLDELMARGYEDAYRQFIEPVVGESGEQLARAHGSSTATSIPSGLVAP